MKIGIDVDEWWPYYDLRKPEEERRYVIKATPAEVKHWTKVIKNFGKVMSIIDERVNEKYL